MEVRNVQLPTPRLGGPAQAEAARRLHRADAEPGSPVAQSPDGDTIAISPEARQAIVVDRLVQQVLAMPDARPEVVAAAGAALARGDLDSPAAIDAAIDALFQAGQPSSR